MGLLKKWRNKRFKRYMMKGQFELTPRGLCILNYCRDISKGKITENNMIEDYENYIQVFCDKIKQSREDTAAMLVTIFERGHNALD